MDNFGQHPLEALKTVQVVSLKENARDNKIVIHFPSKDQKVKGKTSLAKAFNDSKVQVDDERKMLPKVTVANIPSYLIAHISSKQLTTAEYRQQVNSYLKEKFLEKNDVIEEMVKKDERTFEIVYVKSGYNYTTAGIKVSPAIRTYLMEQGFIYISETRCRVIDRIDLKQCFKCQKIGHIASQCRENTVCMYCGGAHTTGACPYKDCPEYHRCRNCHLSTTVAIRENCHTHHSSDESCPIIQENMNVLKQRTEYSKN